MLLISNEGRDPSYLRKVANYFFFLLATIATKTGITIREARKQVPTPMNKAMPIDPKPRYVANQSDPKPTMVVIEVRKIALPVLANTGRWAPQPSKL